MVIIHSKTLEKKGVDDVTSKDSNFELSKPMSMSQGAALFCGVIESSRWRDVGRSCGAQPRPVGSSLESLWDALPGTYHQSPLTAATPWPAGAISTLLQDLSLSETVTSHALSSAPPSKRQCRSLSCSDELAIGCRSPWRPQSSRVWTAVEKRRCYSGGSVVTARAGHSGGLAAGMQRSSSFSLPARSNALELPCLLTSSSSGSSPQYPPFSSSFSGLLTSPTSPSSCTSSPSKPTCPPIYLSHEQICLTESRGASKACCSSSDSTPELGRRGAGGANGGGQGGLARSRSQPCVLNDKKIGVKRRRPADIYMQRPSLDLAKMTQKLPTFHSLSCPGIPGVDESLAPPSLFSPSQDETAFTCVANRGQPGPHSSPERGGTHTQGDEDSSTDELDTDGDLNSRMTDENQRGPLWVGLCETQRDAYQLGGELDIEQIERN